MAYSVRQAPTTFVDLAPVSMPWQTTATSTAMESRQPSNWPQHPTKVCILVSYHTKVSNDRSVFGMGIDLSSFLGIYASVMAGDLTSCSIGGPTTDGGLLSGLGLVGKPQGLSNSHNRFEADASPTRADLYSTYVFPRKNSFQDPLSMSMTDYMQWKPSRPQSGPIREARSKASRPQRLRSFCSGPVPR
jgi:hypothetical protein